MKLKHVAMILGVISMFLFMGGCGDDESAADETTGETADNPPADEGSGDEGAAETGGDEAAGGEEAAGGGSICSRARECCNAYVGALPTGGGITAETACAGVAQVENTPMADTACQNLINGWRQSLEALPNVEVPAACAAQ